MTGVERPGRNHASNRAKGIADVPWYSITALRHWWRYGDRWDQFALTLGVVIAASLVWIPSYYLLITDIPSRQNLLVSTGDITIKRTGRFNYQTFLRKAKGETEVFSCHFGSYTSNHCFSASTIPTEDRMGKTFKEAKVMWFPFPLSPWSNENFIAEAAIQGKTVLHREDQVLQLKRSRIYSIIGSILFFLLFFRYLATAIRNSLSKGFD